MEAGRYLLQCTAKTAAHLFRLDPSTGTVVRITQPDNLMAGSVSLSRDGQKLAFTASSPTTLSEVFVTDTQKFAPRVLTNMTEQTKNLTLGTRELVRWKSTDGTEIEVCTY
jgi:dipeptidyl aminopeptidase/acylaminoacyl peptidase